MKPPALTARGAGDPSFLSSVIHTWEGLIMTRTACTLTAAAVLAVAGDVRAQTFDLTWHTIDCGGGATSGDGWDLVASIAQPDAGYMSTGRSDGFTLTGGFWPDPVAPC